MSVGGPALGDERKAGDRFLSANASGQPATTVLGIPISLVTIPSAIQTIVRWVNAGQAHFVCVRDVHGVMRAQKDASLLEIHQRAGMVTPDGMPLVWIARARGHDVLRTCGADLVAALCAASEAEGLRHYFYGGKPGVAERMAKVLQARYPRLDVVGIESPPFGEMTPEVDEAATAAISAARPHIVWVGLSTPKQEYWMQAHVSRIPGATLIGVGAAFDFYAGDVKRAPGWMQRAGLEWLHRFASEPRRLWRRYLVMAPQFLVLLGLSQLGLGRRNVR